MKFIVVVQTVTSGSSKQATQVVPHLLTSTQQARDQTEIEKVEQDFCFHIFYNCVLSRNILQNKD